MLEVGLRVVRGHDWKWNDQDGGEGHAGTVVEIGKPSGSSGAAASGSNPADKTPDKTVIVQWDHGSRSNYRIGYQGYYDLLVFDNATTGVQHNSIVCNGCMRHGIVGVRWKCAQCFDYDLCTQCYMGDVHDLTHTFQRLQTPNAVGVQLTAREGCTKIPLKGIFIGAKVVRGPDWEWGNQDGGPVKTGRVMDIRGWDNESSRSVATVTWSSGSTNVYRLGYKGCVDLCYIEEATAGTYYKEHLPILGQPVMTVSDEVTSNGSIQCGNVTCSSATSTTPTNATATTTTTPTDTTTSSRYHLSFNVRDKVKVMRDVESLKEMQAGHGGWNPRMVEYIGKIGTVHRITDKGDVRVQYEDCNNRWTFHPRALTKVTSKGTFALGDLVSVKTDATAVKNYQQGHGEWTDVMKNALGKTGKVIKIYSDGDLRVTLDGHTWTFNPLSVTRIASANNSANASGAGMKSSRGSSSGGSTFPLERAAREMEKLMRETARGEARVSAFREYIRKYSDNMDARASSLCGGKKTCLQVAAHQGHRELCLILLDVGVSVCDADEDGDPALHYAAFGNQPEVMSLLLSRGAPIDAVNNGRCSALHVAVNKQHSGCVRVLLRHGCDVNLQDSYGDTALHDAIGKDALDIINALCACERVQFTLQNKRGFNVLHHAALKGNAHATQQLLTRCRHLVDVKKEDGFGALHLAALNGHYEVSALLLSESGGGARVDLRNNRRQTPLHLAVSQGHWALVELLLKHKADISSTDEEGDTVLHIAIGKSRHQPTPVLTPDNVEESTRIYAIWQELSRQGAPTELALACFLVSIDTSGLLLEHRNAKGKTPLDLLQPEQQTPGIHELVRSFRNGGSRRGANGTSDEGESTETGATSSSAPGSPSDRLSAVTVERTTAPKAPLSNRVNDDSTESSRGRVDDACRACVGSSPRLVDVTREDNPSGSVPAPRNNCQCLGTIEPQAFTGNNTIGEATTSLSRVESPTSEDAVTGGGTESGDNGSNAEKNERERDKDKDLERLRYLETRIADLEEANMCSICMERRRNVAFLCGHGACDYCATPLKTCHMCRKTITKKINLY